MFKYRLVASISLACMLVPTVLGNSTNSSNVSKVVNATEAASEILIPKFDELEAPFSPESLDSIRIGMKKALFVIAKLMVITGHPYAAWFLTSIADCIKDSEMLK